jgi:hypothetical protein
MGVEWDPGFRVGLGWDTECDGWDVGVFWTWMKNSSCNSSRSSNDIGLTNPWVDPFMYLFLNETEAGGNSYFDKIRAKWRLTFNQVDLEIGRKYWSSRCFALRPYAALRGAWWKTRFNTQSQLTTDELSVSFQDKFTNESWGVGFLGGLQPTWYFCSTFALYSNFDVALIWGELKTKKHEDYLLIAEGAEFPILNSWKGTFSQVTPMLDTAIGLRWEETWCCDRYRTALDCGWEYHVLFDVNHRNKVFLMPTDEEVTGVISSFVEATGNIGLGGFVLRARFDF